MKNKNSAAAPGSPETMACLSALLQARAENLFARILAAECAQYLRRFSHIKDELGRDAVVRNGYQPVRRIVTGVGAIPVRVPKVRSRTGDAAVFHSNIVPRYVRSTKTTSEESLWRYLHGIHCCDLNQVLAALLGPQAAHVAGLVPEAVRQEWLADCGRKRSGPLGGAGMEALWAVRVAADRSRAAFSASMLVVLGADASGRTRLIALDNGTGEGQSRWMLVVRNLLERGLRVPDSVHCGAGAAGFGRALEMLRDGQTAREARPASAAGEMPGPHVTGFGLGQWPVPA